MIKGDSMRMLLGLRLWQQYTVTFGVVISIFSFWFFGWYSPLRDRLYVVQSACMHADEHAMCEQKLLAQHEQLTKELADMRTRIHGVASSVDIVSEMVVAASQASVHMRECSVNPNDNQVFCVVDSELSSLLSYLQIVISKPGISIDHSAIEQCNGDRHYTMKLTLCVH